MTLNNIYCDYIDCKNPNSTSWNWLTASNGLDELVFCSQKHHDLWMEKNAGNFWDIKGLGTDDVRYGPKTIKTEDNGKIEYNCKFSPYIIEENKQAIIQSLMLQFQGYNLNPVIVSPQDSNNFVITLDKEDLSINDIKDKILNNYFIESASTRSEAKTVRNLHVDLNKNASINDITSNIIALTKANKKSDANHVKVEWVPLEDVHRIREFDRLDPIYDTGNSRSTVDNIKSSLLKNGFINPLKVSYNMNDRYAYLGEGNHRIIAAKELGLTHVPVTVYRYGESNNHGYKGRGWAKQFPGVEPDQFGYVPGNMTPTQIGLTHPSNVRTASLRTAIPYHVSPVEHRESIEENGLLPGTEESNKWPSSIEPLVYMSPTDKDADLWGYQIGNERHSQEIKSRHEMDRWNSDDPIGYPDLEDIDLERQDADSFDLWHVNTEGLPVEKRKTDMGVDEIVYKGHITPDRITHIKQFWASVNGQGYDAPVDSNLHAPGAQDPEGAQYIIDQANITGPQVEASIKEALPYHVSPAHNRESIEQEGLKTFGIEHHNWYIDPGANVYMSPTDEDKEIWAHHIQHTYERSGRPAPQEFDLYHVDLDNFHSDRPGFTDIGKEEIVSKAPIPPERITHIERFTPKKKNW